ncbi:MAG: hypothetical protein FWD54_03240 [Endomicrobia bacterium]|nr:hypothetical protein [Endomicrobiia bacterium]MCL2799277.1 hypothetical protein [Endomicrobiia bacterium]
MKKIIASTFLTALFASVVFAASMVNPLKVEVPLSLSSDADVKKAIIAGCQEKGWVPAEKGDNQIDAVLNLRGHSVTVKIAYDKSGYSIEYKDSSNMNYNDKKNLIHSKYNQWVGNLNKAIRQNIDFSKTGK